MIKGKGYFEEVGESCRATLVDLFNNPSLWSDTMVTKTLQRIGGSAFSIHDVQLIIKDYLSVLAEAIRKGEEF